jgi:hypothetical protein
MIYTGNGILILEQKIVTVHVVCYEHFTFVPNFVSF